MKCLRAIMTGTAFIASTSVMATPSLMDCLQNEHSSTCKYQMAAALSKDGSSLTVPKTQAFSLFALKNTIYHGIDGIEASFRLQNGIWVGEPYQPGGSIMPQVILVPDIIAKGDLTADQQDDAVVMLDFSPGGTGQYLYLAVMENRLGQPINIATQFVGDRVRVKDLHIENGKIIMTAIEPSSTDAMCCPGNVVKRIWQLQNHQLVEEKSQESVQRLTLNLLDNSGWKLDSWQYGEPVSANTHITLRYQDEHLVGKTACHSYSIAVRDTLRPGFINLAADYSTMDTTECTTEQQDADKRYLEQLAHVNQFTFFAGRLTLSYNTNGHLGVMIFSPQISSEN
ncbi:TPA: META domain-containing protein [Photobacterium damselae]